MSAPPEIVDELPLGLRQSPSRPPSNLRPDRLWLHLLLFVLTFISALFAQLPVARNETWLQILAIPWNEPDRLWQAVPFAATLMAILLAHEMGHYVTARRYQVDQSLPYFIPAPTFFGTLGAVIVMRSQPRNRRMLLNVAVMGPYAGLVLAIPAAAWGLAHSVPVYPESMPLAATEFGDSLLFAALERWFSPNGTDVILHPVGMAGWVGLFITSLNLIPAAQLDGGHVAYALFGRFQEKISLAVVVTMLFFGFRSACIGDLDGDQSGSMWILWAFLLYFIGIRHPPVQDEETPLTRGQKLNGLFALAVFILTFIPVPIKIIGDAVLEDDEPGIEEPFDGPSAPTEKKSLPDSNQPAEEFKL